jgi:hypothetical protein
MKVKEGTELRHLNAAMRPLLIIADQVLKRKQLTLYVTSTREGIHSAGSLHYYGYAMDFKPYEPKANDHSILSLLALEMQEELDKLYPNAYDIVVERTHIHGEYDIAKNMIDSLINIDMRIINNEEKSYSH